MNPGSLCSLARALERGMLASGKGATARCRRVSRAAKRPHSELGKIHIGAK